MNSGPNGTWRDNSHVRHSLPVTGWSLWYADGSVVRSTARPWSDAPEKGVQVQIVYHPGGRRTFSDGYDAYCLPGAPSEKLGLEIAWDDYVRIHDAARADEWRPAE